MTVAGKSTIALHVRVFRVTAAELPRLRSLQNRVAAILTILAARDAVDGVVAALEQLARSPGPFDDVRRLLPFAVNLAKMPESDKPRFRRRLEEAGMVNVITLMEEEARAEGRSEGRAEGRAEALAQTSHATVATFRRLVDSGVLSSAAARAELHNLMDIGAITREIGQEALSQFQ